MPTKLEVIKPKSKKSHALLTETQAVQIFSFRCKCTQRGSIDSMPTATIAKQYGVCEKTIRDIWSGRTWKDETQHLDQTRPVSVDKQPVRPMGAQASRSRKSSSDKARTGLQPKSIRKPDWIDVKSVNDELFVWELQSSFPPVDPAVYEQEDDF